MSVVWEPQHEEIAATWRDRARGIAAEHVAPLAEEIDRDQRYPTEHIETFVEEGLTGMLVPEEFGGAGLSMEAICAITEEISAACSSTGAILAAHALGAVPVLLAGTPDQKRELLGDLLRGSSISFALTEVGAGSDAAAIRNSPSDIASWPATARITRLDLGPGGVRIDFTKRDGPGSWPDVAFLTPGENLQYTLWIVLNINGQWYASGCIQFWRGLDRNERAPRGVTGGTRHSAMPELLAERRP